MQSVYPVLQSGFIASNLTGLRKPVVIDPSLRETVLFKGTKQPLANYYFSQEVSGLYFEWCANPKVLRDFDFRERLLRAAFRAFNTTSFFRWLELQQDKPHYSDMHKQFIAETIEYLFLNKPRSIHVAQWHRLIEASSKTNRVKMDLRKYFGENNISGPQLIPTSLIKVINRWVTIQGGFEDMLISLFVIFGSRAGVSEITNTTRA